jgi:hypothetical protein
LSFRQGPEIGSSEPATDLLRIRVARLAAGVKSLDVALA